MRIVIGLASIVLAACFTKPARPLEADPTGDAPSADGWLEGWDYRKRIEVHPGISGTLSEFPIAIARTDPDLTAHSNNGRDLVVTEADGISKVSVELVAYDAGTFELWARIPELAEGTAIYLYYGGEDQLPTTAVWDGLFQGVWHLSDSGVARDSSAFTNHMTSTGGTRVPASAAGVFGGARLLDGDDTLTGGDPPNGAVDFGTRSFSYSMWVFQQTNLGEFDTPFFKGGPSANEPGYCWLLGSPWTAKVHDGIDLAAPELGPASLFQNRWVHLVAVVDRDAGLITAYADGGAIAVPELLDVGDLSNGQQIEIGRTELGTAPFSGVIDEVRVYNGALSVDWIRAEHANGLAPDFLDVKPEEQRL